MSLFENMVLRKIVGRKRDEETGGLEENAYRPFYAAYSATVAMPQDKS